MPIPRVPDVLPILRGAGLTLREMSEEDLSAWHARLNDAEAAALAGDPVGASMAVVVDALEHHRRAFRAKEAVRWAIVPDDVGCSVGSIGLGPLGGEGPPEIGAAIGRAAWGQGIATGAGRLVLDYAFSVLGIGRVDAVVLPANARVRHVLARLGFVFRGTESGAGDGAVRERWILEASAVAPPERLP